MTRYILLALFMILCNYAADRIVDRQLVHEDHGYTAAERTAMQRLIEREVPKQGMTAREKVRMIEDVFNIQPGEYQ